MPLCQHDIIMQLPFVYSKLHRQSSGKVKFSQAFVCPTRAGCHTPFDADNPLEEDPLRQMPPGGTHPLEGDIPLETPPRGRPPWKEHGTRQEVTSYCLGRNIRPDRK